MYYRARCLCTTAERYEQEQNRAGSIAWLIPPSIDNRLVDELTEQLAELALPRPGLRLGQENGDQVFLRIDPERRAPRATPGVLAGGTEGAVQAIRPTNREAQTEAIARGQLRGRGLDVPEVIRGHVAYGRPGQEPLAVELPALRQHVEEARVVHCGARRTRAPRV